MMRAVGIRVAVLRTTALQPILADPLFSCVSSISRDHCCKLYLSHINATLPPPRHSVFQTHMHQISRDKTAVSVSPRNHTLLGSRVHEKGLASAATRLVRQTHSTHPMKEVRLTGRSKRRWPWCEGESTCRLQSEARNEGLPCTTAVHDHVTPSELPPSPPAEMRRTALKLADISDLLRRCT